MTKVDVIIPVYRGLVETSECIISAYNTLPEWANLIVVNDSSPEPELSKWLIEHSETYNYTLYENKENLGFVATVNFAMALNANNDVLLLNSDVEVENDWLDRIQEVAYLDEKIGSVTPFSNNATICSYPNFCEDNRLAKGKSLKEIDLAFSKANNPEQYIEIPTGVGFCMFIKRKCLDDVGLFDLETFGKGYGEENDWCQRAIVNGWSNVHAVNVFAYHKGGVSFADEQHPRQKVALELLLGKHPNYTADVMQFVANDPAKMARIRAAIELVRRSERSVLQVEHALGGGVTRHVDDLVLHLEPTIASVRLRQSGDNVELLIDESNKLQFNVNSDREKLFQILHYLNFSLVHFHHIHGLDPSFLSLSEQLSTPYCITAHDYYLVSGNAALTNDLGEFFGDESTEVVLEKSKSNRLAGYMFADADSAATLTKFIVNASMVIYPSRDTMERFCRFYDVSDRSVVAHHREEIYGLEGIAIEKNTSEKVKVLVVGAISLEKGAQLLNDFANKYGEELEINVLGYSCIPLHDHIVDHGQYSDSELLAKISNISPDVVWYTSQCAETYCYTLTPAIALGLPIVAPNIGAFTERLAGLPEVKLLNDFNDIDSAYSGMLDLVSCTRGKPYCYAERNTGKQSDFYKKEYLAIVKPLEVVELEPGFEISSLLESRNAETLAPTASHYFYDMALKIYRSPLGRVIGRIVPPHYLRKIKRKVFG
ncbi:glycosyltransferase [Enterovibrio calviensis]|uniref:glycosyltransferase n=1 Tax=Enterovibrio calviensis TaxID=91359 RepID=UPI000688D78E|nr:glycosyltransferase [Enterovibrio calviensis]